MLGALHIEDKIYQKLGKIIRGSGWEWAMTKADVFTSGRVSSSLDDNHIKRSRYIHQVSVVAFSVLKQESYGEYCIEYHGEGSRDTLDKWSSDQADKYPIFFFGSL